MATRQTTIRFPDRTDQQITEMVALFGDVTKTVVVAIDRLYQVERGEKTMSEKMTKADALELALEHAGLDVDECRDLNVEGRLDRDGDFAGHVVQLTSDIPVWVSADGECEFIRS